MAKEDRIPEVDIVVDHNAGVIREVHPISCAAAKGMSGG